MGSFMKKSTLLVVAVMMLFSCAGKVPDNLGVKKRMLAECPGKKNCVNSQSTDKTFFIEAFKYEGTRDAAIRKLKKKIASFDRIVIAEESKNYLRYECKSAIMGFVDDLEFFFSEDNVIHIRSAARLGYFDFGVNRKRVERLRKLYYSQ